MLSQTFITGLGCISGAGLDLPTTLKQMNTGKRNPKPPTRIGYQLDKHYPVYEVVGLEEWANDLSFHFAETAIKEALCQADLDEKLLPKCRVGIVLGSTAGCFFNKEAYYRKYRHDKNGAASYIAQELLKGSVAHRLAAKFGLSGPALTLSNACASGTDAIGLAAQLLENMQCDIVIAGGCDEIVRMVYLGFISLMNTSDEPCVPFAKSRKGLNLGEGSGICILESQASVKQRRVQPLGSVRGYATVADAYHITAPEPAGRGLKQAFVKALDQAEIKPEEVAFINTHGTGTTENDRVEGQAIAELFGREMAITATKVYTGHALGAAGGLEAVLTTQFLRNQAIPGVWDYDDYDSECGVKPHHGIKRISGEYACSTSLAFGGVNSVLVIGGAP